MIRNYIIEYNAYDKQNKLIERKKMRVKNKTNDYFAIVALSDYLSRKLENFDRLEVISCKVDDPTEDFLKGFKDSDPFNFFK